MIRILTRAEIRKFFETGNWEPIAQFFHRPTEQIQQMTWAGLMRLATDSDSLARLHGVSIGMIENALKRREPSGSVLTSPMLVPKPVKKKKPRPIKVDQAKPKKPKPAKIDQSRLEEFAKYLSVSLIEAEKALKSGAIIMPNDFEVSKMEPKPRIIPTKPISLQDLNDERTRVLRIKRLGKQGKPELSVILPVFRGKHIAWLPLESLARQTDIDFPWEIVMAEEIEKVHDPFTWEKVQSYFGKLRNANCVSIKYFGLKQWIPLGQKVFFLIRNTHPSSKVLARQGGDMYSAPTRLATHHKIIMEGYDWVVQPKTIMYRIKDGAQLLISSNIKNYHGDSCFNTVKMGLAKKVKPVARRMGIDSYFYKSCRKIKGAAGIQFYVNNDESWLEGFTTHGLNNLSIANSKTNEPSQRDKAFKNPYGRWQRSPIDIRHYIPVEVTEQLKKAAEYLEAHMAHHVWPPLSNLL